VNKPKQTSNPNPNPNSNLPKTQPQIMALSSVHVQNKLNVRPSDVHKILSLQTHSPIPFTQTHTHTIEPQIETAQLSLFAFGANQNKQEDWLNDASGHGTHHLYTNQTNKPKTDHEFIVLFSVQNIRTPTPTLVDTGSSLSFISEQFLENLPYAFRKSVTRTFSPALEVQTCGGVIYTSSVLSLELSHPLVKFKHDFYVLPFLINLPLILGRDSILLHNLLQTCEYNPEKNFAHALEFDVSGGVTQKYVEKSNQKEVEASLGKTKETNKPNQNQKQNQTRETNKPNQKQNITQTRETNKPNQPFDLFLSKRQNTTQNSAKTNKYVKLSDPNNIEVTVNNFTNKNDNVHDNVITNKNKTTVGFR
jgi:hypothetical protein